MTVINTIDQRGNQHEFEVLTKDFIHKEFKGKSYRIKLKTDPLWKFFDFVILFIKNDWILIYRLNNNGFEEVSKKGIVKAMIEEIRNEYAMTIVSSTNIDNEKLDETEGRVSFVNKYWNKWYRENPKISYDQKEDRFIYEL
jgi:hypothetical protein